MDTELSEDDKREFCRIILLGCSRATACKYFGTTAAHLQTLLGQDAEFARQLQRAEATAEMRHMGNVHSASQDEKNWRTSVWWLERHDRDAGQQAEAQGQLPPEVQTALDQLAELIVSQITQRDRRESLLQRLKQTAHGIAGSAARHSIVARLPQITSVPVIDQPAADDGSIADPSNPGSDE